MSEDFLRCPHIFVWRKLSQLVHYCDKSPKYSDSIGRVHIVWSFAFNCNILGTFCFFIISGYLIDSYHWFRKMQFISFQNRKIMRSLWNSEDTLAQKQDIWSYYVLLKYCCLLYTSKLYVFTYKKLSVPSRQYYSDI